MVVDDNLSVRELFELKGQNAIVTGAGGGIGGELCHALAEMGADVALVDTNRANMEKVASELQMYGGNAIICETDVTKAAEVEGTVSRVLDEWRRIAILVNCAGISHWAPAEEMKEDDWDRVMNINLKGTFLCCKAVARNMITNRRGKIINIASMSGSIVNYPQRQIAYNASKAGVVMLTKSLAAEWARYNINVNSISPGYISTEMTKKSPQYHNEWKRLTPMKRLGEPSELKGAVVFLASEASRLMTGHDMIIDAGYTIW
jgi:NAD(P)-dependent dehydrogenase (short-subunit alcohol dehydrogenase family)